MLFFSDWRLHLNTKINQNIKKKMHVEKLLQSKKMFPARLELATFRVLGGRDNHYTTETKVKEFSVIKLFKWRISNKSYIIHTNCAIGATNVSGTLIN